MRCEETPFSGHWWGTGIDDVAERPNVGTYGRYRSASLPPLPFELRGEFEWLAKEPTRSSHIGQERARENAVALAALRANASQLGLCLPNSFLKFLSTPFLQARVRSSTDCYLYVCSAPIPSPIGGGFLIRFLADSQGCVFWYIYIPPHGSDHAVVSSPGFYGTADEQWEDEPADPSELVFSEQSFESFLCRFWLENEIFFAKYDGTPLSDAGRNYLEQYRKIS